MLRSPSLSQLILDCCSHIISSLYSISSSSCFVFKIASRFDRGSSLSSNSKLLLSCSSCLVTWPNFSLLQVFKSWVMVYNATARAPRSLPGFRFFQAFSTTTPSSSSRSHMISYLNVWQCDSWSSGRGTSSSALWSEREEVRCCKLALG